MNKIYHITPESKYDSALLEELSKIFEKYDPHVSFDFSADDSDEALQSFKEALINKISENRWHPLHNQRAIYFICEGKRYTLHFMQHTQFEKGRVLPFSFR